MGEVIEINGQNLASESSQTLIDLSIGIQRSHLLSNLRSKEGGFVVTIWPREEWLDLIRSGSQLYIYKDAGDALAYVLVSPIFEFTKLLASGQHDLNLTFTDEWRYLYQASVKPGSLKKGVGSKLIRQAMARSGAKYFVADFMIYPDENNASMRLLSHLGFSQAGTLTLESYRGNPPTKWQVMKSV